MTGDLHHLAAAYALDALDHDERDAFEVHLRTCAACRDVVDEFHDTAGQLAVASATAPPGDLRGRVLEEIGRTRQRAAVESIAGRRRRRPPLVAALATAAAIVVALIGAALLTSTGDRPDGVAAVLAAPDAVETTLSPTPDGDGGAVRVVWSQDRDQVAVIGEGLRDPGEGRIYELWAITGDTTTPAGLFDTADGSIREVSDVTDIAGGEVAAWGITIEPAGGSTAPTTPVLFFAPVFPDTTV